MKRVKNMNFGNARHPEQIAKMKQLEKDGVCFLCKKNFTKYQKTPILREKKWWIVRKNDFPYEGSKLHLLLVYKKHIDSLEKISTSAMPELLDHLRWIRKKFSVPGGTFTMRFGDSNYNGASITHLHAHIVSGYKKGKNTKPLFAGIAGFRK